MPLISVDMFPGRTDQQKRDLSARLTTAFVDVCGGETSAVWVLLREVPREHWSVGGVLRSERGRISERDHSE